MTQGCIHVHIKDGKITNIFSHLTDLPTNGVVHLSPDQTLTESEFKLSHPHDKNELSMTDTSKIFNLGSDSI